MQICKFLKTPTMKNFSSAVKRNITYRAEGVTLGEKKRFLNLAVLCTEQDVLKKIKEKGINFRENEHFYQPSKKNEI